MIALGVAIGISSLAVGTASLAVLYRRRRRRVWLERARAHRYWELAIEQVERSGVRPTLGLQSLQLIGTQLLRGDAEQALFRVISVPHHAREKPAKTVDSSLFYALMFFIPREIRAPWFDHLLEDREEARRQGRSRLFIASFTIAQCLALLAHCVFNFVWDVFNPFKPRS